MAHESKTQNHFESCRQEHRRQQQRRQEDRDKNPIARTIITATAVPTTAATVPVPTTTTLFTMGNKQSLEEDLINLRIVSKQVSVHLLSLVVVVVVVAYSIDYRLIIVPLASLSHLTHYLSPSLLTDGPIIEKV
jgi:hypothetical protein